MKISVSGVAEKLKLKDLNGGEVFIFEDEAYCDGDFCTDYVAMVLGDGSYVYLSNGTRMCSGQDKPVIILDAELLVKEREA